MSDISAQRGDRRAILAWAFYDWANSAFTTTVVAGFFPVFFKQYWSAGHDATTSTLHLGNANAISSLLILLLAPVLGAIADRGGLRRRFLCFFMLLGVLATASLYLVGQGMWLQAALLFVVAGMGFSGSVIFNDALILDVARDDQLDRVSAFGFALGYLGGGLLFAVNVTMTLRPHWFGLADAAEAVRVSFLSVAVWWLLFTLPLLFVVRERAPREPVPLWRAVTGGFAQLAETAREIRALKTVALFLAAYWLYIDGVDTIIRMAVDYGLALGFKSSSLIVALLIVQFVGFPAALLFGWLGARIGTKRALYIGIVVYMGVTVWGYFLENENEFYLMAVTIGLVQGGIQSLSRSFYARLIPPDKSAEFFGFYNMLGKFAAVIGPVLVGWTAVLSGSSRLSILSLLLLFAGGALLLAFVREQRPGPARP